MHPQKIGVLYALSRKVCLGTNDLVKQQLLRRYTAILFSNLLLLCTRMGVMQFFNEIMGDNPWQKIRCPFLAEYFEEQIYEWPPCSPDLNPLDFFPRSFLKNIVCKDARRSIAELKKKIENAIRIINSTLCRKIFANLLKWASLSLTNERGHFEHRWWFIYLFI